MVLTWLIVGLAIAVAIARINQSNKLFWAAFTSLMLGIAVGSLINRVDQDEESLTQVYPTQMVVETPSSYSFLADVPTTTQSFVPNTVSKDSTLIISEVTSLHKEPFKKTLTDPPDCKNTLKTD
jgi:hypothetical protein